MPLPETVSAETLTVRVGESHAPEALVDRLVQQGFEVVEFVATPGEVAVRGGIRAGDWAKPWTVALEYGGIGHSLGIAGRTDSARATLARLEAARDSGRWVAPEYLALVQLGLGDHDAAIAHFEEALESGSSAVPFYGLFPLARDVWDDPRFKALIARGQEPVRRSGSAGSP